MDGVSFRRIAVVVSMAAVVMAPGSTAHANHSWGGYHWARTSNPFTVQLGDNVSSTWDAHLSTSSIDWSASIVLNTTIVPGSTSPKTCKATSGKVQVCNSTYGRTGWLGIASVWVSASHITQATVKLNDTYFKTAPYNTSAWRNMVMCQEIGHTFGLDHQDEDFDNPNLGTCMDYTSDPASNQNPNTHDYDQLAVIYAHLDSSTSVAGTTAAALGDEAGNTPAAWGHLVSGAAEPGSAATYARRVGTGAVFTFVVWA